MALVVLSCDVADSPTAPAVREGLAAAVGTRQAWRLLSRLWMIRCASNADFRALAAACEALHQSSPSAFDYFALHYDPAGGPVLVAPNPALRAPVPLLTEALARKAAPRPRARPPVAVPLRPAGALLDALESSHASTLSGPSAGPERARESRRPRAGTPRRRSRGRRGGAPHRRPGP